jgi:uncharacterized membrane protein YfcA
LTLGFGLSQSEASVQSIILVGASCLVGVGLHSRLGNVEFKKGIQFSIPSILTMAFSRAVLPVVVPDPELRDRVLLGFFVTVVSLASFFMIRPQKVHEQGGAPQSRLRVLGGGMLAGLIIGLAGAGGGFVIVPSLNVGLGMPIRKAIATSLWVISFSSFSFLLIQVAKQGDLQGLWSYERSAVALMGVPFGIWASQKIDARKLRPAFGVFALSIAIVTLVLRS